MTDDQELRLECLRICINVAEAKNAYFWINGEGRLNSANQQGAAFGGVQSQNQQIVAGRQMQGPTTFGSGTIG